MERKHVMVEGVPGKESTDAKEIQENASNDIKKSTRNYFRIRGRGYNTDTNNEHK